MQTATLTSTCAAPKWAKVPSFLRDQAWTLGLKIEIEVDKGWIRENVRFRVEGDAEKVKEFEARMEQAGNEYNSR